MDPPEGSQENTESGDFLLNLSDAEQEASATTLESSTSDTDNTEFTPLEFGANAAINLEEVEVEGLGLGLEPLEDEPSESPPATSETEPEENVLEISESPEVIDLSPEPEVVDLTPEDESSDSPIEVAVDEELEIATASPSEDETLEINDLSEVSLDENTDAEDAKEEEVVQVEEEPAAPVLDLGEDEIALEIDEDPELESPPPPPPAQIDELELNLEIDDSEGPLATTNTETPELEIEDLGLELEGSDSPPDAEKP